MKVRLSILVLLLISFNSFSQTPFDYNAEINKSVSVPNSPEASAFSSYGDVPIDLRLGKTNVSVPLYTYKGIEFDIPISLTYNMDNRKVADIASNVGLGWNLNLGARVTRNLNDKADSYTFIENPYTTIYGDTNKRDQYVEYKDIFFVHNMDNQYQDIEFTDVNDARDYFDFIADVQLGKLDIALDSYDINGLGLNDHILTIIDEDNSNSLVATPVNNPRLKVSNYGSYWEVIDEKGTIYSFYDHEITNSSHSDDSGSSNHSPIAINMDYISSWLLTKVVSANGKDVYDFSYTDLGDWQDDVVLWVTQYKNIPPKYQEDNIEQEINPSHQYKIKQKVLTSVKHNGKTIIDITLKSRLDLSIDSAIESITVKDPITGNTINHFNFNHTYFGQNNGDPTKELRLKLDKIEISGNGYGQSGYNHQKEYSFDYHNASDMPTRDSKAQDRFGYYNGEDNNSVLYPKWDTGTYLFAGAIRDFDLASAKVGILTKVHYPQGGYTEFNYERHTNGTDNFDGLRIASLINYTDQNDIATKKTFTYSDLVKNFEPILTYTNPYPYIREVNNGIFDTKTAYVRMAQPALSGQPYISYGTVTETMVNPSSGQASYGSTVHRFYNELSGFIENNFNGYVIEEFFPFRKHYFENIEKGKLKSSTVKNAANQGVESVSHTYTTDPTIFYNTNYTITEYPEYRQYFLKLKYNSNNKVAFDYEQGIINNSGGVDAPGISIPNGDIAILQDEAYAMMKPTGSYTHLKNQSAQSKTEVQYLDGTAVGTTTDMTYDDTVNYLLRETSVNTSIDNKTILTEYSYPEDDLTDLINVDLIAENKESTPIQVQTFQKEGSNPKELLQTQKTEFYNWGGIDVYGSPVQKYLLAPKSIKFEKGGTGNNLEKRVSFNSYDQNGNLVSVSQPNGAITSYIWGYNGQHVVAKLENIAHSSISQNDIDAIEQESDDTNYSESNLLSDLDALRNNYPEAQITTFTYIPLIGVSIITDSKGYRVKYVYDQENRLKYIIDADGKVEAENRYNYRINN